MTDAALTFYVLIWPAIVAVVLFILTRGFFREWMQARRDGEDII